MSAPSLTIRPATDDDAEALARIYLDARMAHFHWVPRSELALTDFARDSQYEIVWVATDTNAHVLGFVSVWEPDSFIHLLFVAPGYENQGIGRALLQHLDLWLPFPHRLKCVAVNQPALAFYRRLGWQEAGEGMDGGHRYLILERYQRN